MTDFFKSSYSSDTWNCVEIAAAPGAVLVRDSKLGEESPVLEFETGAWRQFVAGLRGGGMAATGGRS